MCSVIASSGSSGAGATWGPVSARTAGLRARISLSSRPSWRASASTRSATEAPVIRLPPVSVSMPMRISWAWSARRIARLRCSRAISCRLVSSASAGTASRSASVRSRRCSAKAGQRGAEPPDPPGAPQPACGGDRVQLAEHRRLGLDLPGEPQVDGDVAVDADDDVAAGHLRLGGRAGQDHRFAHRFAERGDPEVGLEFGEGRGEGLGDRARAVDRPARNAADLGGDRARLQQPQLLVGGDRPLDVLRPAEHRRRPWPTARRAAAGRPPPAAGRRWRRTRATLAFDGSSTYREPSTSPLTSGSGPPRTALTTRRSVRPVTGSMPNITPPYAGSISGWTSTAIGCSAAPARFRESSTAVTAVDEGVEAADPDDRLELTGHRRRRHVLDHGGAASDQRLLVATGPLEGLAHGGCAGHVGAGIDGVGERRGQHDAGERRQPGGTTPCQRRRLATGERGIERRRVAEGDHEVVVRCRRWRRRPCADPLRSWPALLTPFTRRLPGGNAVS